MSICVIVPSHLHYGDQFVRLALCLKSLIGQTVKPDIYVSISFSEEPGYKEAVSAMIKSFGKHGVKFKVHAGQTYQMDHIASMMDTVSKYDLVMFCDDDDTYDTRRVQLFGELYKNATAQGQPPVAYRETVEGTDYGNGVPEYWAYALPPSTLRVFFDRMHADKDLMQHKYGDMYLRMYLYRCKGNIAAWPALSREDALYKYNVTNPNSITGKIQILKHKGADMATMMDANRDSYICACISRTSAQLTALRKVDKGIDRYLPLKTRIDAVCERLYDYPVVYKG
jgi:hypothetical protein